MSVWDINQRRDLSCGDLRSVECHVERRRIERRRLAVCTFLGVRCIRPKRSTCLIPRNNDRQIHRPIHSRIPRTIHDPIRAEVPITTNVRSTRCIPLLFERPLRVLRASTSRMVDGLYSHPVKAISSKMISNCEPSNAGRGRELRRYSERFVSFRYL